MESFGLEQTTIRIARNLAHPRFEQGLLQTLARKKRLCEEREGAGEEWLVFNWSQKNVFMDSK